MIFYLIRKDKIEYLKRSVINILFIHIGEIKNIRQMQRENKTKQKEPFFQGRNDPNEDSHAIEK